MCTVFKVRRLLLHQAKIGFVYEGCGLQRVVGTFSAKVVMREAAEFVVDQRNQAAQGFFITGPPLGQQLADRLGGGLWHGTPPRFLRKTQYPSLRDEVNLLKQRSLTRGVVFFVEQFFLST
jgi:hypothetical protein